MTVKFDLIFMIFLSRWNLLRVIELSCVFICLSTLRSGNIYWKTVWISTIIITNLRLPHYVFFRSVRVAQVSRRELPHLWHDPQSSEQWSVHRLGPKAVSCLSSLSERLSIAQWCWCVRQPWYCVCHHRHCADRICSTDWMLCLRLSAWCRRSTGTTP